MNNKLRGFLFSTLLLAFAIPFGFLTADLSENVSYRGAPRGETPGYQRRMDRTDDRQGRQEGRMDDRDTRQEDRHGDSWRLDDDRVEQDRLRDTDKLLDNPRRLRR